VLKDGRRVASSVLLRDKNEVLTGIQVTRKTTRAEPFDFVEEARAVESTFSDNVESCSITEKNARCSFSTDARTPVYRVSVNFGHRSKSYKLNFYPSAIKAKAQLQAAREASGVLCFVDADPASFDDVFMCMGGYRHTQGVGASANRFAGSNIATSGCGDIWARYQAALREAGVESETEINKRKPDCDIFAQVSHEISGRPAYWSGCTGYKGTNEEHVRQCLETFIPGYYGHGGNAEKILKNAGDCNKLARDYQLGVRAASSDRALPSDFSPLGCDVANKLLVAWGGRSETELSACQDYSPDSVVEHIDKCLALNRQELAWLRDCNQVRQKYELKLRQTYGSLPDNYILLRCSDTGPILEQAEAVRQKIIAERRAERTRQEKIRAQQIAAANKEWNEKFRESQKIAKGLDVTRGPVVGPGRIEELEDEAGDVNLGDIREYQQPGLLLALFAGEFELVQPRRGAALTYINAFHDAFANSEQPSCMLASDPGTRLMLQDAIMTELGMDKLLSPDVGEAGALGLGVMLSMMQELTTQGAGPMVNRVRNIEFIKEQAFYDAMRLAQARNCNQDAAKALFRRAVEFVNYKG